MYLLTLVSTKKKIDKKAVFPASLKEAVQGREKTSVDTQTVLGIDINQFKHSIDLLKYSLEYADAIVNTVREPLIVLNKDLNVITANLSFYKAFNIIPDNVENRPFYELGEGELDIPQLRKLLHRVITKGTSFDDFEIKYHVPNNGTRILLLNARKFYRQVNATQTILLAIEDVTAIRNYEKQKDEFAAIIMHELKGPVSTIKAYNHLMQAYLSKSGNKKLLAYADNIAKQIGRLTALINGLLDSSRIRAVGFEFENKIFDLDELLAQTIKDMQKTIKSHSIQRIGKTNAFVNGDKERIAQVLINLVINAVRFSPNATNIIIKTYTKNSMTVIGVEDFGVGISDKYQKKVFEPFFQIQNTQKETLYGVGLGLDISAQIIAHHKGKMWVNSSEGKGSVFHFSLPQFQG